MAFLTLPRRFLCLVWLCCFTTGVSASDADTALVKKQRDKAQANWQKAFDKEKRVEHESANFLLYGASDTKKNDLRDLADLLEKQAEQSRKPLKVDAKASLWSGKLAVYVFTDRKQLVNFARSVEKRRIDDGDLGTFWTEGDSPHITVCDPPTKKETTRVQQAMDQHAAGLLTKYAQCPLPAWLLSGFSRATAWRANPKASRRDRDQAKHFLTKNKRTMRDVWSSTLDADEAPYLRGALVEFLAYGAHTATFLEFIKGFKMMNDQPRSMEDILKDIKVTPEELDKDWKEWVKDGMKG